MGLYDLRVVTCPTCGSDDLDLVERLAGDARILRCLQCGHQWQRGEVPQPAVPGLTTEQRLRARFPTVEDISSKRLKAFRELTTNPGRPRWSEYQGEFRDRYRELFSQDGLAQMTVDDFVDFYVSDAIANVGPAQFAANATLKELGPGAFLESVRAALEYLLYDERGPLEQRLTDLIDGHRSPALKGIREAILTKVLATAWPDRIFPLLVYDSEEGSGKRQIAAAILGLNLPPRDRTDWTIGRLAIWSNDLFADVANLGFTDLPSAADFVWWLWTRHREGQDIFPPLTASKSSSMTTRDTFGG